MLAFIAERLALEPANFGGYAERDQTRREHLAEIQTLVGYRIFNRASYRDMSALLLPTALHITVRWPETISIQFWGEIVKASVGAGVAASVRLIFACFLSMRCGSPHGTRRSGRPWHGPYAGAGGFSRWRSYGGHEKAISGPPPFRLLEAALARD